MRIVIVNCFDTYEERVDSLCKYFSQKNHEVFVIESDFSHILKEYRSDKKKHYIYIVTKKYNRNISMQRIISHADFAKKAVNRLYDLAPDLVYALIPPNSLVKHMAKYKKEYVNQKVIFDIIDMWPETMPIIKYKKCFPFVWWKKIRDSYIQCADFLITECDLYQEHLKNVYPLNRIETIYLTKEQAARRTTHILGKKLNICYLGSINNIIDISLIVKILKKLKDHHKVEFHIIGDGEQKDILLMALEQIGIKIHFYGKLYDEDKKSVILQACDFGLNIMKSTVHVGLTMKSLDYFKNGLPVINNIRGDTEHIIEKYNIGYNVVGQDIELDRIDAILKELPEYQLRTYKTFDVLFSFDSFENRLDLIGKVNSLW